MTLMADAVETTHQSRQLAALAAEYFDACLDADPLYASSLGFPGHDDEVPDPSRLAEQHQVQVLQSFEDRLKSIDPSVLTGDDRITSSVLASRLRHSIDEMATGLSEVSVSGGAAGELTGVLSSVPAAILTDAPKAASYLRRLAGLGSYFDSLAIRYAQAKADGRFPTAGGLQQAIDQMEQYLASDLAGDPLVRPLPPTGVDAAAWSTAAQELVADVVRPAIGRLREFMVHDLASFARDDEHVGLCHVPGGAEGYDALIRYYTTTLMSAEQIHAMGWELLARIREEIGELGAVALGKADADAVLRELRDNPTHRFDSPEQILAYLNAANHRAEKALPGWFRDYALPPCAIRDMNPHEARNGVVAYYRWPSLDGGRPGTLWVNTQRSDQWQIAGLESLTFHEAVPGHHLQASVRADTDLPDFRRYRKVVAHSEGWGLYVERLADEMGLYSSDVARLGMLSDSARRACRLIVDTGIHHYGWSRQRATQLMKESTAQADSNIENEIERYIAAPAQALSYMTGQVKIADLRRIASEQMHSAFQIAEFHHQILAHGSLPLDTLEQIVLDWAGQPHR